jgi:short-subunit dehydrogenase
MMKKTIDQNISWQTVAWAAAGGLVAYLAFLKKKEVYDFRDKVVLVTGGSRGLGFILTRQFAEAGAKVLVCGRDEKTLDAARRKMLMEDLVVNTYVCDLTQKQQVDDMIGQIEKRFGTIDILVNNAGTIQVGPMENMEEKNYQQAMDLHFWAPFHLVQKVLPAMLEKGGGRIVNIVSIGGKVSFPHLLPYNASKFALSGFSEGLTAELAGKNVKVTTVYPGLMRTGSPLNIDVKGQTKKEYSWFKISDSLPIISMNAEKAAAKIIKAIGKGKKTLKLTFPARLAISLHGLYPSLNITLFELVERLLPDFKESNETGIGHENQTKASRSVLGKATDKAAEKYNQR